MTIHNLILKWYEQQFMQRTLQAKNKLMVYLLVLNKQLKKYENY